MALTLRPTGLQSPACEDWPDYSIFEGSYRIGRLYEDRAVGTQPELRWFWSITVVVDTRWRARRWACSLTRRSEDAILRQLDEVEGVGQSRRAGGLAIMTKKRRYLPRIVGDKVMMPADLKRLHKYRPLHMGR
jgi:hypothetical protein